MLLKRLKIVIAGLVLLSLVSCAQPKPLVYRDLQNFRVQSLNLQQATMVLDLQFYNPNNYGLTLKDGDIDAYFNNKFVGKASLAGRSSIPAKDTFTTPVIVTTSLQSLVANALELLTAGDKVVLIRLQGSVRAGKGNIYFRVPVNYEGRQTIHL
ncbi:MAG: LEA type 2 family protein [Chitinophagaceae bacterium]